MKSGLVFVVDDNPDNLRLLSGLLSAAGYEVRVANSGRRALAALQQAPADLVLLDITMPDLDGFEVCAALRADRRTSELPVIFLSALDDVRDKISAFRAGGVDYVTKPFQSEEVLARVETQLRLSRLRRELAQKNEELQLANEALTHAFGDADQLFAALASALPGTVLDERFRLEQQIGAGGAAVVFRATHLPSGRAVAVKVQRPLPGADGERRRARLRREGTLLARLEHPNAAQVLASGVTQGGIAYLAMELLHGRTLQDELHATGRLRLSRCAEVFAPVCSALAEAHRQGIVHRDVKPANIFLHRPAGSGAGENQGRGEGELSEVVKLLDFGIAREAGDGARAPRLLGSPVYMSPERLRGEAGEAACDAWSLGVSIHEALSGSLPHGVSGDLRELLRLREEQRPAALPAGVPEPLREWVLRSLEVAPAARPSLQALEAALLAARDAPDLPAQRFQPDPSETLSLPQQQKLR